MDQITDQIILKRLADGQEPEALAELVRRYGGLVYFTALRQVRDPHLAEDISQAVFIVLMRKARSIRPDAVLASWFFTVTRHAINNARRMENRRRIHEGRKAAMTDDQYQPAEIADDGPHPLLSEAIGKLSETDRSAVVLRYFQNRTTREVAESLAISEEATRKRLSRALEKMRSFLENRGLTDTQAVLSAGLTQSLSIGPAPAALAKSIVNVVLISHTAGASASVLTIAKGAARMITFTPQVKAAVVAIGVFILLGAVAVPLLKSAPTSQQASAPASQPAGNPSPVAVAPDGAAGFDVSKEIKVEVLGVSPYPGKADSWFDVSGNPIKRPSFRVRGGPRFGQGQMDQMLVRIRRPEGVLVSGTFQDLTFMGSNGVTAAPGSETELYVFQPAAGAKTATLLMYFSEADWQTILTDDKPQQAEDFDVKDYGKYHIDAADEEDGTGPGNRSSLPQGGKLLPTVTLTRNLSNAPAKSMSGPMRLVVVDNAGNVHDSIGQSQSGTLGKQTTTARFDMPLENIKQVLVQVRPFTKTVKISDISLEAGQVTKPEMSVVDLTKEADKK